MPPAGTTRLVTGDGVPLDVQVAQLPVRAVAALIDWFVMGVSMFALALLSIPAMAKSSPAYQYAIATLLLLTVFIGYPMAVETATRGRSPGKLIMGLRVVSDDGGPERIRQALIRTLTGVVEFWSLLGLPAIWTSLFSANGKRMGDLFAGTMVIAERGPRAALVPPMPPELQWWASTLELSGLGSDQANRARQFLARAANLLPRVRAELGNHFATEVISRISPPPPPNTPGERAMAAVVAERHRRILLRLQPPPAHGPSSPATSSPAAAPSSGFALPN